MTQLKCTSRLPAYVESTSMVDCKHLFQEFHPGRFLVFTSLLLFGVLLSFRLEEVVGGSYWGVFVPLWFWKFVMITGCAVGIRYYISQQVIGSLS